MLIFGSTPKPPVPFCKPTMLSFQLLPGPCDPKPLFSPAKQVVNMTNEDAKTTAKLAG